MGYTHYWRRAPELDAVAFRKAAEDIRLIIEEVQEQGIEIAGPTGVGKFQSDYETIAFNGKKDCGHRYKDLGFTHPSDKAKGVTLGKPQIVGSGYAGALLSARSCGGTCKGGEFLIDRTFIVREWDQLEKGRYFGFCETHFRPYDLAVTASLIRLKERLGDEIIVTSDDQTPDENHWQEAKRLCRELFGWAPKFSIEPQGSEALGSSLPDL